MVLQGFSGATYVGWLFGVIFIKNPKGSPLFPPRKSLYTIWAATVYVVMTAVWMDFHYRHLKALQHDSPVDKFLSCSLFFGATIFDLYFRACFFFKAKLIVRFLKSLETDTQKIPLLQFSSKDRRTWKSYNNFIKFVQFYCYFGAVFTAVWVATLLPPDTRLFGFISREIYPIIFLLFGTIPLVSSSFVSFSLVVASTLHILWIFEDFNIMFEEQIIIQENQIFNSVKKELGEIYALPSSKQGCNEKILSKFEHLRLLCAQYDKIVGPLLLGLLVRAVFILISAANTILLFTGNTVDRKLKLRLNVYHFATEFSQLMLLQLGYMVHRRMAERREELHRKVILMTNIGLRDQMKEAVSVIADWKWCVSGGPGFFHIDRPLLSGVLSSLMTYVTILFQLNVADDSGSTDDLVTSFSNDTSTSVPI